MGSVQPPGNISPTNVPGKAGSVVGSQSSPQSEQLSVFIDHDAPSHIQSQAQSSPELTDWSDDVEQNDGDCELGDELPDGLELDGELDGELELDDELELDGELELELRDELELDPVTAHCTNHLPSWRVILTIVPSGTQPFTK